ncbi:hypothetical protein EAF04_010146 [Stromatinia cepivora]|nr:hypothetical protein EAF04_010146 [Stromatinia cepivora]
MDITKESVVTSPQNFTSEPLLNLPPADKKITLQIVQEIKRRRVGRSTCKNPWREYELNAEEYAEVLRLIERDESLAGFVKHKLRYDYFPFAKKLILRRPLYVQEVFKARIVENLQQQLTSIASGNSRSADFAKDVGSGGSATITFADSDYGRHDPDNQFGHLRAQYSGVIIEVSFPQKRKYMNRLADEYILGSDSNIHVMIGIDIEYQGSKKVTLSVWQPKVVPNEDGILELVAAKTVIDEIIRDENGNPNKSAQAGLHLPLKDFAPGTLVAHYESKDEPMKESLCISASTLCGYLESVESAAAMLEAGRGLVNTKMQFVKKRYRARTPEDEFDEEYS